MTREDEMKDQIGISIGGLTALIANLQSVIDQANADGDIELVKRAGHFLNMESNSYNIGMLIVFLREHKNEIA